jgi:hypothetical protein
VAKSLHHLRIHDVTIDGGDRRNDTLDARGHVSATWERVRFEAWSSGAAVTASGSGYLAFRECVFLGGRRGRRSLFAISVRGNSLVFAKSCIFADMEAALGGWSGATSASHVRFEDCRFLSSPVADSRSATHDGAAQFPISVRGGRALLGGDISEDDRAKRWGVSYVAHLEGVTFGPDPDRPTVAHLLDVVERAPLPPSGVWVGVESVAPAREGRSAQYRLFAWDGKSAHNVVFAADVGPHEVKLVVDPSGGGVGPPRAGDLDGLPSFATAVRRSGIPLSSDATSITIQVPGGAKRVPHVFVAGHTIDLTTGEVVGRRR